MPAQKKPASKAAPKKKTTTKSSASPKKPAAKKAASKKNTQTDSSAKALWLFASALLLFAVVFIKGSSVWADIHAFLYGLFSFYAIVFPVLLLVLACFVALGKHRDSVGFRVTLIFVAVILLCSITQNFTAGYPEETFLELLKLTYKEGASASGGGVASLILGYPLTLLCGNVAAIVVMFILLLVDLMLLTGISVGSILRFFGSIPTAFQNGVADSFDRSERVKKPQKEPKPVKAVEKTIKAEQDEALIHLEKQQYQAEKEAKRIREKQKEEREKADQERQKAAAKQVEEAQQEDVPIEEPKSMLPEKEPAPKPDVEVENLIHRILSKQDVGDDPFAQMGKEPQNKPEQRQQKEEKEPSKQEQTPVSMDIEIEHIQKAYEYPPISLLNPPKNNGNRDVSGELRSNAALLVQTLESFGVKTRLVDISRGPTVTRYELQPAAGVKISKVTGLADDIALNLAAAGVRIEAPIPNKAAIGIEVPNKTTDIVSIREIIDTPEFKNAKSKLTVALGKDIAGNVITTDLSKMPHTLIAGSTGSGKSVCINSLLMSILYKAKPEEVRLLLVDPKVVELGIYNGIPHLLVPVVTDPRKAAGALQWAVGEMLKRYNEFADKGVRDIKGFNELASHRSDLQPMPQIVIVIDELADLMMAAPSEVEDSICRLAQMARAAGMYLVIATQRPSVDVITGIIKANIPSRIAFAVSSQVDSRTILDAGGAEKLLGKGDMLFYPSGSPKPTRLQGCFVTDKEVEEVVQFVSEDHRVYDNTIMDAIEQNAVAEKGDSSMANNVGESDGDPLYEQAVACVMEAGQASTSYIQRKLKVGYARAARLMDEMEEKGVVGPSEGSKPRQIIRRDQN